MTDIQTPVRVRIAPSPTGDPHVGTAYTALFNRAFARQHGGAFVLRIEDTDRNRFKPESEEAIFAALRWLDLQWDEGPDVGGPYGPYRQSERLPLYREHADQLVASGHAYPCFCSSQRLDAMRKEQQARSEAPHYDRRCRYLSPEAIAEFRAEKVPEVIRFAMPVDGDTSFHDLIRGEITFANENLQDPVIVKTDGYPTYHLAAVVDDHLMAITHVARGEEWVPSTPIHVQLYRAFGWEPPAFAHVPVLRNTSRQKLSKRRDPTSIMLYKDRGYLPEAMINFLGQLGWTLSDGREIFGFDDIVQHFDWSQMTPAGPIFDLKRFDWYNGMYIRALEPAELVRRLEPFVPDLAPEFLARVVPLLQERISVLSEVRDLLRFFCEAPTVYVAQDLAGKRHDAHETLVALQRTQERLISLVNWTAQPILDAVGAVAEELDWKLRDLFAPSLYVAITGEPRGLPLPQSMEILGKDESLQRLHAAIKTLS